MDELNESKKTPGPNKKSLIIVVVPLLVGLALLVFGIYTYFNMKSEINNLRVQNEVLNDQAEEANSDSIVDQEGADNQEQGSEIYDGWTKYSNKFGISFWHPNEYTVRTQIEDAKSIEDAVEKGINSIEVTSYVPNGKLRCEVRGQSIPQCEVKVSFVVEAQRKISTYIIPQDTELGSVAQKIKGSLKY